MRFEAETHEKTQKPMYPWIVLVNCCLLQGAGLGIISNCTGVFYVPVMQSFNCTMAQISLYVTINNVFQCVGTIFVARVIQKVKIKYAIPAAGLIVGLAQVSLAFSRSLAQWYICAVIQGFFVVYITGIIIPLVVVNWFSKRTGLALGLTSMAAGLSGAVFGAVLGSIITAYSWRVAILVSGLAILVMSVPGSWVFMALTPQEKGCTPFGGFQLGTSQATSANKGKGEGNGACRRGRGEGVGVVSIVIVTTCVSFSTIFNNQFPALGQASGVTLVAPAMLLSINMVGNMGFKIGFGALNDYIGAKRTSLLSLLILGVASALLMLGNDVIMCIAALLFGINAFLSTTQCPLMAKDVCRVERYPVVLQVVQIATRLSYAIFAYVEGALLDLWGFYRPLLMLQITAAVIAAIFVEIIYSRFGTGRGWTGGR